MRRFGLSMRKGLIYSVALAIWLFGMVITLSMVHLMLRGRFEKYWIAAIFLMFGAAVFFGDLAKRFIKDCFARFILPVEPMLTVGIHETNALVAAKDSIPMSEPSKLIFNNAASVTINQNTTHNNVQGGIIGSGTVQIHHHIEGKETKTIAPFPEDGEAWRTAEVVSARENDVVVVSERIREIRKAFKKKWSDLVRIAEMLVTRPNQEIQGKEIWAALRPGETYDGNARSHISTCVTTIREILATEQNGWHIPDNRYIIVPDAGNTASDAVILASFLAVVKAAE